MKLLPSKSVITAVLTSVLTGLAMAAALSGCLVQTDNSVNGDASQFAPLPPGESKEFAQVSVIFKKNCAQCHSSDWVGLTQQQLITQKWIIPGDPDLSKIYGHLKGSDAHGGFTEDMPQNLPPLSRQDIRTIHDWIEDLAAPAPAPTPSTPFGRAQAVILTNCATCHHHTTWNQFSESDFIAKQLVVPGSADDSTLYQNLNGANVPGVDPGEMPLNSPALASADLLTIATWINQIPLTEASPSPTASPSPAPSPTPSTSQSVGPSPSPSPVPSVSAPVLLNASQRTTAALAVFSNSCSDCHGVAKTATSTAYQGKSVGAFTNFTADSDFVTAGLVTVGDPSTSWLIRSLKGYGDIASMPKGGNPALSSADEATLAAWINGIGQP